MRKWLVWPDGFLASSWGFKRTLWSAVSAAPYRATTRVMDSISIGGRMRRMRSIWAENKCGSRLGHLSIPNILCITRVLSLEGFLRSGWTSGFFNSVVKMFEPCPAEWSNTTNNNHYNNNMDTLRNNDMVEYSSVMLPSSGVATNDQLQNNQHYAHNDQCKRGHIVRIIHYFVTWSTPSSKGTLLWMKMTNPKRILGHCVRLWSCEAS